MVLLTVCTTDVFGETCQVGMQGSLSKTLYEVDEPIDLVLTFENQGHTEPAFSSVLLPYRLRQLTLYRC